ncbi:spore protease YyaC [Clostridium rectalis]|uniref:spore protease YyaC n=1 Tax=Clostridium rectalis TaxID=2040295 RepID=UPI000F63E610|nr:spore protease YyaC [Clostridium rectalis]
MKKKILIDASDFNSTITLRDTLNEYINNALESGRIIILLCIGSDRSTGDSLGPLVGHKLRFLSRDNFHIYGSLENPVHAKNLHSTLENINKTFKNPYIIAIDACLGSVQNIGKICIEEKPLSPGSAMNKNLPLVGNISITGIVNVCGALEFVILQNTRLNTVMQLAETISQGVYHSIVKSIGRKKIYNDS